MTAPGARDDLLVIDEDPIVLLFKKIFFDAIADGTKTTTLRYWKHRRVKAGSVHTVPWLGKVRIDSIEPVRPGDLSESDVRADGFETLDELHGALGQMYGPSPASDGRQLFLVRFTFLGRKPATD